MIAKSGQVHGRAVQVATETMEPFGVGGIDQRWLEKIVFPAGCGRFLIRVEFPPAMSLPAGTRLGDYEIVAPIGAGGMGELYRARDTRLGRDAAIKILRSDVASDALRRKRFEEEAKAASALNHPNIITIYQIGDFESSPFIAMELVDGTTLRERLEHGPLELSEVRHIARQLCEGLQKAHDSGVVHLKPDNIMVTRDGLVKIVDFGLAQLLGLASTIEFEAETLTKEASVTSGTLAYMAPEQALGKPQDGRSDLFSLGVMLYEITTGRKPFVGETVAAVFDAILHQAPSTAGLPAPLEPVILRCLEKKPDARFASALELQAAIAEDTSAVPTTDELSIAVVPFKNLSTDQDAEFFCDGLTEDITLDLAKVGNLRVISRTSAKQLKDSEKDLRAQGRELGVQYVLEGSVRRAGANVRITAQLIHVETDAHVWGERFSGTLEDIFAIQEELLRKIVDALKLTLTPEEDRAFAERPFDDVRAYECYTRAHEEQWRWSKDGLERSLRLLDSGLEIIGDHELLYAAKGIVYWQFMVGGMQPRDSSFAEATRYCEKVFELGGRSSLAHFLRGALEIFGGSAQAAARNFHKALEIQPDDRDALYWLCFVQAWAGHTDAARLLVARLLEIDPLTAANYWIVGAVEMIAGRFDAAADGLQTFMDRDPKSQFPVYFLVMVLARAGRIDETASLESALKAVTWRASARRSRRSSRRSARGTMAWPAISRPPARLRAPRKRRSIYSRPRSTSVGSAPSFGFGTTSPSSTFMGTSGSWSEHGKRLPRSWSRRRTSQHSRVWLRIRFSRWKPILKEGRS